MTSNNTTPLWQLGFRPFFLFGVPSGAALLSVWMGALSGISSLTHITPLWHAHEMIFGFALAIIAGFLFTASQNWSGKPGVQGSALKAAATVWLLGRIAFILPEVPTELVATMDLLFLPAVVILLFPHLGTSGQRRNVIFLILLTSLWLTNLAFHLDYLPIGSKIGLTAGVSRPALYIATHLIVVMILAISSRVLPFFSERALTRFHRRQWPALDMSILVGAVIFAVAYPIWPMSATALAISSILAILTATRLASWIHLEIREHPMLWILYAGYATIPLGFAMSAAATQGLVTQSTALHAFTAGTISIMIAGMVARVSLGHTGRPIKASKPIVLTFVAIIAACIFRLTAPALPTAAYLAVIYLSAACWILASLVLTGVLLPILTKARADAKT